MQSILSDIIILTASIIHSAALSRIDAALGALSVSIAQVKA